MTMLLIDVLLRRLQRPFRLLWSRHLLHDWRRLRVCRPSLAYDVVHFGA